LENPYEQEERMADTDTRTHITQVGTVMIPVSDQDRALEFYLDKLGFEKRTDVPYGDGERWIDVAPAGAATTIALVPPREGDPTGIETRVAFTTDDIDAEHADLRSRGVNVDEAVMRMGDPVPPMFFFRDQDGNRFVIIQGG
jgi:catechol 2,3-dioxygenase-like lactoylglutathione lyase family enzyme